MKDNFRSSIEERTNKSASKQLETTGDVWHLNTIYSADDDTDKQYAILTLDSEEKFRVLIRTTNHGIVLQAAKKSGENPSEKPISFTVKPEFLPEIGAEVFDIF